MKKLSLLMTLLAVIITVGCAAYVEPTPLYYGPYYGASPSVIIGPTYYWGYHGPYYRGYYWHSQGGYYHHKPYNPPPHNPPPHYR